MKKITAIALFTVMMISLFACTNNGKPSNTTASSQTTDAGETNEDISPKLPDVKYDGDSFYVLMSGITDGFNDFGTEEVDGYKIVNEAIYRRNSAVEEKYDIVIKPTVSTGAAGGGGVGYTTVRKDYTSGGATYDLCFVGTYDAAQLVMVNALYNLNALPYLNLKNKWWDQNANFDLAIDGKMFYTTGDISIRDNLITHAIFFNKDLAEQEGITDMYQRVENGTWTMDVLLSNIMKVGRDLNGDDKMDSSDLYGAFTWQDSLQATLVGNDIRICRLDSDGLLELTLFSDKAVTVMDDFTKVIFDKNHVISHCIYTELQNTANAVSFFANNQALYWMTIMRNSVDMRDIDVDYGILPYPKYDETQKSYYSYVGNTLSVMMCVEYFVSDIEKTGILIEALGYESYRYITPAYYEQTLIGRVVRDDESIITLDIIFANRGYDIGITYRIADYTGELSKMMWGYYNNFTTMYKQLENTAKKSVDKLNLQIIEWEDD